MDGDAHQILVHAGARVTRKDDERHVQEARSYFQDTRWTRVARDDTVAASLRSAARDRLQHEQSQTSTQHQISLLEDTQLAYSELQSQLPLSSAPARLPSVKKATRKASSNANPRIPYSAAKRRHSLAPGISQSSYLVTPTLDRSKRARLREESASSPHDHDHVELDSLRFDAARTSPPQDRAIPAERGKEMNSGPGTINTNDTTSELPTSYSLSDIASGSSKERPHMPEKSTSDPGPHALNGSLEDSNHEVGRKGLISKVANQATSVSGARTETRIRDRQVVFLSEDDLATLRSLPMEIRPPAPKTDVANFTTHVTQALLFLADESPAANCYKPISTSRTIETWDRGHWRFDCSRWPVERRVAFWQMLQKAIDDGSAGSDVWCTWGPETRYSDDTTAGDIASNECFGLVRVYCWGEIVRHIYVLLYVASSSKVRHLGLQWLDSERTVVVQMPEEPGG